MAQPYPARPRWAGDFHRIEASLFAGGGLAETRADDFAEAYVPRPSRVRRSAAISDRYLMTQLPDMPSFKIDVGLLDGIVRPRSPR